MALRTPPLPLDAIAFVAERYNAKMQGRGYLRNPPPLSTHINGSSFDLICVSEGGGIKVYANRGDAEKQMYTDRVRLFTEQITEAELEVGRAESAHKHSLKMSAEAASEHKALMKSQVDERQTRLEFCRDEVVRLRGLRDDANEFVKNWSGHSEEIIRDDSVEGPLFVLMEVGAEESKTGTPLDQVAAKIKDGDPFTIETIRMLLPPEELSHTQVLAWMLAQDKVNKPKMTGLIKTFMEERRAAEGSDLQSMQQEGSVVGGTDGEGQPATEPVPALSGAAPTVGDGGTATQPAVKPASKRKRG
jgi:hypothetical protein